MCRSHPALMTLGAILLAILAAPLPAGADEVPLPDPLPADTTGLHCVYVLQPVFEDQDTGTVTADAVLQGCYESFEEAVEAGSGGTIDLAAGIAPSELTQQDLAASEEAEPSASGADVLIGEEFDETNFGAGSKLYFAPTGCAQNNYQDAYVGDVWNNRFESGKGFHSCDSNRKFQHQDFGGDVRTCTPNCADYNNLRNEVSSLKWKDGP